MTKIFLIAQNTYREIIRDRILYGLVVFAILLIGLSLALGQLTFAEQARITLDFAMVGIQLSSVILSIFAGSTLVAKEVEKQTILTLLSKPIGRGQFLLGKYLGLVAVISVVITGLSLVIVLIAQILDVELGIPFVAGLLGVGLEALTVLAFTMLFGVLIRPFLTVACTLGVFLIGHWVDSLLFFANKSEDPVFKTLATVVSKGLPNFEVFNWRSLVVYQDPVEWGIVMKASAYGLAWVTVLLSLTAIIFRRKDLV